MFRVSCRTPRTFARHKNPFRVRNSQTQSAGKAKMVRTMPLSIKTEADESIESQGTHPLDCFPSGPWLKRNQAATKSRSCSPPLRKSSRIYARPQCHQARAHVRCPLHCPARQGPCRWSLHNGQGPRVFGEIRQRKRRRRRKSLGPNQPRRNMEHSSPRKHRQRDLLDSRPQAPHLRQRQIHKTLRPLQHPSRIIRPFNNLSRPNRLHRPLPPPQRTHLRRLLQHNFRLRPEPFLFRPAPNPPLAHLNRHYHNPNLQPNRNLPPRLRSNRPLYNPLRPPHLLPLIPPHPHPRRQRPRLEPNGSLQLRRCIRRPQHLPL